MDRRLVLSGLGFCPLTIGHPTAAATEPEVLSLYRAFVDAQNRRDTSAVRECLLDSPHFLWVSDGKAFWGRETMIERMSAFQKAEIWEVIPDYSRSRVVEVAPDAVYLFQPLVLALGPKEGYRRINFLVNVVCRRREGDWRIAALLTTEENPA